MARSRRRRRRARRRARRRPGRRGTAVVVGRAAEELGDRGGDVDEPSRRAGRARRCARPCPRSRTAPAPARCRASRARRGGRPGPPSCARRSAARTGRAPPDGRRAARRGRTRTGTRWRRAVGCGSARSASRPTSRSGDWSASGSRTGDPDALVAVGPGSGAAERHRAVGARHLVLSSTPGSTRRPPCRRSAPAVRRAARRARSVEERSATRREATLTAYRSQVTQPRVAGRRLSSERRSQIAPVPLVPSVTT